MLKKSVNPLAFVTTKQYDHFQIWYVKPVLLVLLKPESHRKSRAVESRVDGDSMDPEGCSIYIPEAGFRFWVKLICRVSGHDLQLYQDIHLKKVRKNDHIGESIMTWL